jgi:hypothetical protein
MFKIINGQLVKYKIVQDDEEEFFRVEAVLYFRYNIFCFKRIEVNQDLNEKNTLKNVFSAIKNITKTLKNITRA